MRPDGHGPRCGLPEASSEAGPGRRAPPGHSGSKITVRPLVNCAADLTNDDRTFGLLGDETGGRRDISVQQHRLTSVVTVRIDQPTGCRNDARRRPSSPSSNTQAIRRCTGLATGQSSAWTLPISSARAWCVASNGRENGFFRRPGCLPLAWVMAGSDTEKRQAYDMVRIWACNASNADGACQRIARRTAGSALQALAS